MNRARTRRSTKHRQTKDSPRHRAARPVRRQSDALSLRARLGIEGGVRGTPDVAADEHLHIRLRRDQLARLRAHTAKTGIPYSFTIRKIIDRYFREGEPEPQAAA